LIDFLIPYYPEINIKDYTIIEIEQALFHIYIKIIGKLLLVSPEPMRKLLKNYLLKFEITNIKQIIISLITGMSVKERRSRVNFLVEEYLDHTDFINALLEKTSLEEIQLAVRKTKYNKAIREGILYYKNNREIFVLEGFLDRLYYDNLNEAHSLIKGRTKDIVDSFISYLIEVYNLRMISRGIKNSIDKKLLEQFLVEDYFFLDEQNLKRLFRIEDLEEFYSNIEKFLKEQQQLKTYRIKSNIVRKHFIWSLQNIYQEYFFKKYKNKIDDINLSTIFKIIELLIKKDKEIKFDIMPNVIRLIHNKYERLEKRYGDL